MHMPTKKPRGQSRIDDVKSASVALAQLTDGLKSIERIYNPQNSKMEPRGKTNRDKLARILRARRKWNILRDNLQNALRNGEVAPELELTAKFAISNFDEHARSFAERLKELKI